MRYFFIIILYLLFSCNQGDVSSIDSSDPFSYLNHNDTVKYVGKEVCKTCHIEIYNSFLETGMGSSFDVSSKHKSLIDDNENIIIYDEFKNLYYHPVWKNDSLFLVEFRLSNNDTVHKRVEKINYIIGSGHHTNSHLYEINGYVHQIPYTFYSQESRSDLPPGYENGNNSRFSRQIGLECMSCHNAYSDHDETSVNRYNRIANGIDCERCHGPGEIHVAQKSKGIIIDTSKYTDYSIVNPRRLSQDLQFDVCKRCHLQGTAVLQEGKGWEDFLPGKNLNEFIEVYLPKYENDDHFIMASHVDRLQQSKCYNSAQINCITCHNPHKSVRSLSDDFFNNKCLDCHVDVHDTNEKLDCISCHMRKSTSIDIPHVSITDHKISNPEPKKEKGQFIGLVCINNENPTYLSRAKAYLKQFESFESNLVYLDSAKMFLDLSVDENTYPFYIKYFYLNNDYLGLIRYVESYDLDNQYENITNSVLSETYFRIAEAYSQYKFLDVAYENYLRSLEITPNNLRFQLKMAVLEIKMSKFESAKLRLENIIEKNPRYTRAYFNLGSIYMNVYKDNNLAKIYFQKAVDLDPDYKLAKDNLKYIENFDD